MLRIGIVAGEASGDLLAAGLVKAIRDRYPDAAIEGIAGPRMQAVGVRSLYPMERLSVMGLVEVLGRYRELKRMQSDLIRHFINNPPDVFIGVDAPDFNLAIETRLRAHSIKTVHYVSPSVWAWRRYRLPGIKRAVDLMLTLFPFEADFYRQHGIPVRYVGHPLADMIEMQVDQARARRDLAIGSEGDLLAILPGSRVSEVSRLADIFVQTASRCIQQRPGMQVIVPLVNAQTHELFRQALQRQAPELPVILVDGRSREVMAAADVVLLASGTAALEAMLLKKPMVVAYRLSPLTYMLARCLVRTKHVSLPNLLAGESLVPELIQGQATPDLLSRAVLDFFRQPMRCKELGRRFGEIHQSLRQNASHAAAAAILDLIDGNTPG